jgi:hypothetical protein
MNTYQVTLTQNELDALAPALRAIEGLREKVANLGPQPSVFEIAFSEDWD